MTPRPQLPDRIEGRGIAQAKRLLEDVLLSDLLTGDPSSMN